MGDCVPSPSYTSMNSNQGKVDKSYSGLILVIRVVIFVGGVLCLVGSWVASLISSIHSSSSSTFSRDSHKGLQTFPTVL